MTSPTDPPFAEGRDVKGRFVPGHRSPGPGNPHAAQVSKLRAALLSSVSEEDMREVIAKLVELAKSGDTRAIRELLDRVLGRPVEADLIERIAQLEALLEQVKP